jgi:hypothetical protein
MLKEEEETKKVTSLLMAQYKCSDTIKATEVTALALQNIVPNNQLNMQQHITQLVQKTVKAHLSTSSKKRKNSPGSKKPQSSLPQKEEGEPTAKKVSFCYPITNEEDDSEENSSLKKKKQKISHQSSSKKKQPPLKKKKQSSKKKQQKHQGNGNQGGKKKGANKGKNKRRKSNSTTRISTY